VARIEALAKLREISPAIDIVRLHTLISQCKNKLSAITSIKAKVTKYSNDISQELDGLRGELDSLFGHLDSASQVASP